VDDGSSAPAEKDARTRLPGGHNITLFVMAPVALDEGIDPELIGSIQDTLWQAFSEALPTPPILGRSALHQKRAQVDGGAGKLERARTLLTTGENLYMNFEYGPAAASLAESSGLFTASLAELNKDDVEKLYRARLLEGLAWLEAGQKEAAKAAFEKLVTIRPEFVPDPSLMPPHATEVFQQALSEVRAKGLGVLEIRTEPPGALVHVDGLERGKSPINVTGLPVGNHGLKMTLPGFGQHREEVQIEAKKSVVREVTLVPTDMELSIRRVQQAAQSGLDPQLVEADLGALMSSAAVHGVVLVGISKRGTGITLHGLRWSPKEKSAVTWRIEGTPKKVDASRLISMLIEPTWPAAQIRGEESPALDVDFDRALLGVGPGFGRNDVIEQVPITSTWWFWATGAGLAAVALGAVGATFLALSMAGNEGGEAPPDQVGMTLEFP
jgi:hypothetical protein